MSRSNPQESTTHPSKRWTEYNGENGSFRYYDKEAVKEDGSKGDNVELGASIVFLYLDTTYTVTGWSEANGCGILANEVKDISNGVLSVKPFKGNTEPKIGTWNSIKDSVKAMGGKFTANVYIAFKGRSGALEIGVLQLKGAAYAAWNEFAKSKGKGIYDGAVKVVDHKDGKKGSVKFKTPIFGMIAASEASNAEALELDKELQAFFKERIPAAVSTAPVTETPSQSAPQSQTPKEEYTNEQMFGEEPPLVESHAPSIDDLDELDDLPF